MLKEVSRQSPTRQNTGGCKMISCMISPVLMKRTSQQASMLQMTDKLRSHGVYGPTYTNIRKSLNQKLDERPEHLDSQAGTAAENLVRTELQRMAADCPNHDAIRFLQGFPEFRCARACLPIPCQLGSTSLVQHHCCLLPLYWRPVVCGSAAD